MTVDGITIIGGASGVALVILAGFMAWVKWRDRD